MHLNDSILFRPIAPGDNAEIAQVIRTVMEEHKIDRPGSVYTDPTTDRLFELFEREGAAYWIIEDQGRIIGGCGIYPTKGLPQGCAELVKLYLLKEARGTGLGERIMRHSIEAAFKVGYSTIYLESMPELNSAIGLYEKLGFKMLHEALGDSGHYACDVWMLLEMDEYHSA